MSLTPVYCNLFWHSFVLHTSHNGVEADHLQGTMSRVLRWSQSFSSRRALLVSQKHLLDPARPPDRPTNDLANERVLLKSIRLEIFPCSAGIARGEARSSIRPAGAPFGSADRPTDAAAPLLGPKLVQQSIWEGREGDTERKEDSKAL